MTRSSIALSFLRIVFIVLICYRLAFADDCEDDPDVGKCQNGGTCQSDKTWQNILGYITSVFCVCEGDFHGVSCEVPGKIKRMEPQSLAVFYEQNAMIGKKLFMGIFIKQFGEEFSGKLTLPEHKFSFNEAIFVSDPFEKFAHDNHGALNFDGSRSWFRKRLDNAKKTTEFFLVYPVSTQKVLADFEASVVLSNKLQPQYKAKFKFSVSLPPNSCLPDIKLQDCSPESQQPTPWSRGSENIVRWAAESSCKVVTFINHWKAYKMCQLIEGDPLSQPYPMERAIKGYKIGKCAKKDENLFQEAEQKELLVKPFMMKYGVSAIQFFIEIRSKKNEYNSAFCWVNITSVALNAKIDGSDFKTIGHRETLILDGTLSYDPNEPPSNQKLRYEWSCFLPSDPDDADCQKDVVIGTGALFRAGFKLIVNNTYTFQLKVLSGLTGKEVPKSDVIHQQISVVPGSPPTLEIVCVLNCAFVSRGSHSEVVFLQVYCIENCDDVDVSPEKYEWSTNADPELNWEQDTFFGKNSDKLAIKELVLKEGNIYVFSVQLLDTPSIDKYMIKMNKRPVVAKNPPCSWSPGSGTIDTDISIQCAGFSDEDTDWPLRFYLYQADNLDHGGEENFGIVMAYLLVEYPWNFTVTKLRLMQGDSKDSFFSKMTVKVRDYYGMSITYAFFLQIRERRRWTIEMVKNMYCGEDPDFPKVPSVSAMLKHGDASQAVRLITTLIEGCARIEGATNETELEEFKINMKEKFVSHLGMIPVNSISALDQVSSVMVKVLQADEKPINHVTARKGGVILDNLSRYLLSRAYIDEKPGHLPTKEVKSIAQTILSSVSSIWVGVSDEPEPEPTPPPTTQDAEYPIYDDITEEAILRVGDSNIAAQHLINSIDMLGKSVAYRLAETLNETIVQTKHINLLVIVDKPKKLRERFMGNNGTGINISQELSEEIEGQASVINLQIATTSKNPFWYKKQAMKVNADIILASVYDRYSKESKLLLQRNANAKARFFDFGPQPRKPLDLRLCLRPSGGRYFEEHRIINLTKDFEDLEYQIIVLRVILDKGASAHVSFNEDEKYSRLSLVLTRNERPSIDDFVNAVTVPTETGVGLEKYTIMFPDKSTADGEWFYLGILPNLEDLKGMVAQGKTQMDLSYALMMSGIRCCIWSDEKNNWITDNCAMAPDSNKMKLHCQCKHWGFFSGSCEAPASRIEPFFYLDLSLSLMFDNMLIIVLVSAILVLLLLLMLWALIKTCRNVRKICITVLEDNKYYERCGYVITVYTGGQRQAGTSANIGIQLLGTRSNSNSHILKDSTRSVLYKNSDSWFLMFTRENLGEIKSIRIWSDCSGHYPAWYCDKVMITCLATKCTQVFIVKNWFAVTLSDRSVYRVIDSATKQELYAKKPLFVDHLRFGFREHHLWFGVWMMHPRSTFTRMQRIAVLGSFILAIMFIILLLYDVPNPNNPATQIDELIYTLSAREILFAILALLVVCPIAFIITLLFIKSENSFKKRVRNENVTPECRLLDPHEEIENGKEEQDLKCHFKNNDFEPTNRSCFSRIVFFSFLMMEPLTPTVTCKPVTGSKAPTCICEGKCQCPRRKKPIRSRNNDGGDNDCQTKGQYYFVSSGKGHYWFPHLFIYVAWLLCISIVVISVFFIIQFGMLFGVTKTWLWITSLALALIFSIFIVEPLKVLLMALLLTFLYRKCPKKMRPEFEVNVKYGGEKEGDPLSKTYEDRLKHRRVRKMYRPLPPDERDKIRSKIELQNQLSDMLIDLFLFVIFILALFIVVWYSRDHLAFASTKNIHNMVVAGTYGTKDELGEVRSEPEFYKYLEQTLVYGLQGMNNYRNEPLNEVGVTLDFTTHLLGIPRLRQLRVRPDSCSVHPVFNGSITTCDPEYAWYYVDTRNYSLSWWRNMKVYQDTATKFKEPWTYKNALEAKSLPMRGKYATYPGSGYVAHLGRTTTNSLMMLQNLNNFEWFSPNTRVVFIEFTTYSSNRNLFNVVSLLIERSATGNWETTENIKTVKLLVTTTEASIWGMVAFFICAVVLVLHLLRNLSKLATLGLRRFSGQIWNVVDLLIVLLCVACVVLYVERSSYVGALLKQLELTNHNEYVSFQSAAFWDIILAYVMALLVAIATLRIWKLLRFGDKFKMLELTLYSAAEALLGMLLMLMILMTMFVIFSHLLLGTTVEHFRDPYRAATTLLASTIGFHDLELDELWAAHPFLGPIFFLCFLMASSIFLVNMFITVVVCYYKSAQYNVVEKKSSYGPIDYLRDELKFHFRIGKKKNDERLRGGADATTFPIAIPKPEAIRNENAVTLDKNRSEAMRFLTIDTLKSGVKGRDVQEGEFQVVSDERLDAMLLITLDEVIKEDDTHENTEKDVFYKGRVRNDVKLVPEKQVLNEENIVNKFGKTRKLVNQEKFDNATGGELSEEFVMLNNNLNYLSRLLDQFDFEYDPAETPFPIRQSKSEPLIVKPHGQRCLRPPIQTEILSPHSESQFEVLPHHSKRPPRCRKINYSQKVNQEYPGSNAVASSSSDAPNSVPQIKKLPPPIKRPLRCRNRDVAQESLWPNSVASTSSYVPNPPSQLETLPYRIKRPPRCRNRDDADKVNQMPFYSPTDDSDNKKEHKKGHHHPGCRSKNSLEDFHRYQQERSPERYTLRSEESERRHKKRHHKQQCHRSNFFDIPQCRKKYHLESFDLMTSVQGRDHCHKRRQHHHSGCRHHRNVDVHAPNQRKKCGNDDTKRWESSASFGPMVYMSRNITGQSPGSSPVEEVLENQINSIEGFTLILNVSGAEVMFKGSRNTMSTFEMDTPQTPSGRSFENQSRQPNSKVSLDRATEKEVMSRSSRSNLSGVGLDASASKSLKKCNRKLSSPSSDEFQANQDCHRGSRTNMSALRVETPRRSFKKLYRNSSSSSSDASRVNHGRLPERELTFKRSRNKVPVLDLETSQASSRRPLLKRNRQSSSNSASSDDCRSTDSDERLRRLPEKRSRENLESSVERKVLPTTKQRHGIGHKRTSASKKTPGRSTRTSKSTQEDKSFDSSSLSSTNARHEGASDYISSSSSLESERSGFVMKSAGASSGRKSSADEHRRRKCCRCQKMKHVKTVQKKLERRQGAQAKEESLSLKPVASTSGSAKSNVDGGALVFPPLIEAKHMKQINGAENETE